jgi:hypothetical protein
VALVSLKSIIVNAPSELRESLDGLTSTRLISRCANFRIGEVDSVNRSAKYTLRSLARRWDTLNKEITEHDHLLGRLTEQASPTLCEGFGIGPDTAAEI